MSDQSPEPVERMCEECGGTGLLWEPEKASVLPEQSPEGLAGECDAFEKPDLSKMHRSELDAEIVHQAKLIELFRQKISLIVRGFEDEGDRVYLESSNDADDLRELDDKLESCGNELFMPWSHGEDLYATIRGLRTENGALTGKLRMAEAELAALRDRTGAGDALLHKASEELHGWADYHKIDGVKSLAQEIDNHLSRTPDREPFDRKTVLEEAAAVLRKVADDLAHEPRPEFDDHAQFQAGRAHQAHLDEKAIRALSTKDGEQGEAK